MENYFIFVEHHGFDKLKFYKIPSSIPYRQLISLGGFRNRQHLFIRETWFYHLFQNEYEEMVQGFNKADKNHTLYTLYQNYLSLPIIDCIDLYDFYDKVGWDKKKKKFINPQKLFARAVNMYYETCYP